MSSVAGRVLMLFKGDYDNSETYESLDVVLYQGLSYVAKGTTTGNAPTNTTYWQKLLDMPTQVDDVPTQNSNNLVKSGGTYTAIDAKADKTDAFLTTDSAETIADADYIPFYDTSASAKKKTLWSSLVSAVTAVFSGATSVTAGAKGTVPAPSAGDEGKFLKGDGSWANPPTPLVMTGADGTNAGTSGLVPAPAATDNTKFLRGDGTYATVATPSDMIGATTQANGTHGLAPAPTTADVGKFLKGDATYDNETWDNVKNKPFNTVDSVYFKVVNGELNTKITGIQSDRDGTASDSSYADVLTKTTGDIVSSSRQYRSRHFEQTKTLSTSVDTTFTFTSDPASILPTDGIYEIFTSIYGVNPKSVAVATAGTVTVVIPKHSSAVSLTVRLYVEYPD